MRALWYQTLVGLLHGLVEIRMLHVAPVDEEALRSSFLAGSLGLGHKALHPAKRRIHLYGQQLLCIAVSIDIGDALQQGARAQVHQLLAIAVQGESDIGIDQHNALEGRQDVVQLRGIGLKELTAGRHVEEQVADRKAAAYGTGTGFLALHTGA